MTREFYGLLNRLSCHQQSFFNHLKILIDSRIHQIMHSSTTSRRLILKCLLLCLVLGVNFEGKATFPEGLELNMSSILFLIITNHGYVHGLVRSLCTSQEEMAMEGERIQLKYQHAPQEEHLELLDLLTTSWKIKNKNESSGERLLITFKGWVEQILKPAWGDLRHDGIVAELKKQIGLNPQQFFIPRQPSKENPNLDQQNMISIYENGIQCMCETLNQISSAFLGITHLGIYLKIPHDTLLDIFKKHKFIKHSIDNHSNVLDQILKIYFMDSVSHDAIASIIPRMSQKLSELIKAIDFTDSEFQSPDNLVTYPPLTPSLTPSREHPTRDAPRVEVFKYLQALLIQNTQAATKDPQNPDFRILFQVPER